MNKVSAKPSTMQCVLIKFFYKNKKNKTWHMTGNIKTQLYRKNTGARDGEQTKPSQNRIGQKNKNKTGLTKWKADVSFF